MLEAGILQRVSPEERKRQEVRGAPGVRGEQGAARSRIGMDEVDDAGGSGGRWLLWMLWEKAVGRENISVLWLTTD